MAIIRSDIQYLIRQIISTSKTQNLTPFLKLYKGMKVIITENLYLKLGIVKWNHQLHSKNFNQQISMDSTKSFNAPTYKCLC
jgi:hypothetical protein